MARIQRNKNAKKKLLSIISIWGRIKFIGRKKVTVIMLMIRILVYSAIKIRANIPLLYSMLNPETNSDSPSAKSNGVRLVSANIVTNQQVNSGSNTSPIGRGALK